MKRGAQHAASWSGTALLSLALVFAASPAAMATASSAPPSAETGTTSPAEPGTPSESTPTSESTRGTSEDSTGSDGSVSPDPEPTPSETPGSTEPATPDPAETTSPNPAETPAEPTPSPDQPAEPTPDPSTPGTPEPTAPGTPDPSEDPTQLPDEPSPTEPAATPAPDAGAPEAEHYLRCGSAFAGPGETETLRLDMSRGITDLSAGSSLTGAAISIQDGVVYYQVPSPLPRGSSQDDFAVRGQAPDGSRVQARCYVGLQEATDGGDDPGEPVPSTLSPTRAAQTEDTPEAAPSAPDSSTPGSATSRATPGGPPIPGMPGYPLPEPNSPQTEAATEAAAGTQDREGEALAQTGLDTLRVSTAVVLALLAIIAGAAALLLASRRVRSTE